MTLGAWAKRRSLFGFFVLACALSWWPWLWYRLDPQAIDGPVLPFGPLLAAAIMLALTGGRPAIGAWLARVVDWRVSFSWYALALLLPAAITAMAVGVTLFLGADLPPGAELPGWGELAARFVVIFVLIGLGEEPAWRGYALPRLIEGRPAVAGALILGLLHALWHLPLFGLDYDLVNVWPWLASLLSMSVVIAWMWRATRGNLLLPALLHASVNTVAFTWEWFDGADQIRLWWIWAGLWVAVAVIVVTSTGPALYQAKPRVMMG